MSEKKKDLLGSAPSKSQVAIVLYNFADGFEASYFERLVLSVIIYSTGVYSIYKIAKILKRSKSECRRTIKDLEDKKLIKFNKKRGYIWSEKVRDYLNPISDPEKGNFQYWHIPDTKNPMLGYFNIDKKITFFELYSQGKLSNKWLQHRFNKSKSTIIRLANNCRQTILAGPKTCVAEDFKPDPFKKTFDAFDIKNSKRDKILKLISHLIKITNLQYGVKGKIENHEIISMIQKYGSEALHIAKTQPGKGEISDLVAWLINQELEFRNQKIGTI